MPNINDVARYIIQYKHDIEFLKGMTHCQAIWTTLIDILDFEWTRYDIETPACRYNQVTDDQYRQFLHVIYGFCNQIILIGDVMNLLEICYNSDKSHYFIDFVHRKFPIGPSPIAQDIVTAINTNAPVPHIHHFFIEELFRL